MCSKFCSDKEDVKDIVQDVFVIAFKKSASLQGRTLIPYLRTIATHECYRKRKQSKFHYDTDTASDEPSLNILELDEALLPQEALETKERQKELLRIIDKLPKQQREMVYLYYYVDLDAKEIAELLQCPIGSVYTTLSRARRAIKCGLEENYKRDGKLAGIAAKSAVLLPLGILFLAEETAYAAVYIPTAITLSVLGVGVGTAGTATAAGASAGAIAAYVAAACAVVIAAVAVVTHFTQDEPEEISQPPPTTTYETTAIPTTTTTSQPPQTTTPTYPEEEEPTSPPPTTAIPTTTPYETTPSDRTNDVLAALAAAHSPECVAGIISDFGFASGIQMMTMLEDQLRFYLFNEGSGDILIGTSLDAGGESWQMNYQFFENAQAPQDGVALYRWMRN